MFIYNNQMLETNPKFHHQLNGQIVVHSYHEISLGNKNSLITVTHNNIDESQHNHAEWMNQTKKALIVYSIYIQTEKIWTVVTRSKAEANQWLPGDGWKDSEERKKRGITKGHGEIFRGMYMFIILIALIIVMVS